MEAQAGLREGSVITIADAAQAIESPDGWRNLCRDLEDVGISPAVLEERREFVVEWVKKAIQDGALEERCDFTCAPSVSTSLDDVGPLVRVDSGYESRAGAESMAERIADLDGKAGPEKRGMLTPGFTLSLANSEFEEELKSQRSGWRPREDEKGGGQWGVAASDAPVPTVKVRRRTHPVVMLSKLFKNETDIIEAASDGDLKAVAKLVSLGMDVNARDRWGWSALSMCGYGGHKQIARLLLDHGANLDNVDVDGDTPSSLAVQRRHAELVLMFDEERERRDQKVREGDKEEPRR